MKRTYLLLAAFTLLAGMTLMNSCKKDDTDSADTATLNQEQAVDVEDVSASADVIDDDIDNIMSTTSLKSTSGVNLPCNVTIDSSFKDNKKLIVNFDGDNCIGTRGRSGRVEVTLTQGTKWSDVGAVLTVKYIDVKITHKGKQKYVKMTGTKTHTNVSGGLVRNLGLSGTPETIVRKIESSDMKISFPNETQRTWNIARTRTFTKVNNNLVITITGFGEADGKNNLVEWGMNRRNSSFYTQISTPVVMSQECDYKPSSGEKIHYIGLRTVTTTLGTDVNGVPVTEGCAEYYKISWTGVDGTKTVILPY